MCRQSIDVKIRLVTVTLVNPFISLWRVFQMHLLNQPIYPLIINLLQLCFTNHKIIMVHLYKGIKFGEILDKINQILMFKKHLMMANNYNSLLEDLLLVIFIGLHPLLLIVSVPHNLVNT